MTMANPVHAAAELLSNTDLSPGIFRLDFSLRNFPEPKGACAGRFFMIKPQRSSVFLGRAISIADWRNHEPAADRTGQVSFLIALRGRGTQELHDMQPGEHAELTGPLGNAWADFLPQAPSGGKPVALIGGGIGLAPLAALLHEDFRAPSGLEFHLYAGFKTAPTMEEQQALLANATRNSCTIIIASEDGTIGKKGRIPDFLQPESYSAVCVCGPEAMMKAVAKRCAAAKTPCFISTERRMACGVGACLGCTVKTHTGNRRCCADGPIFDAKDVIFDD